MGVVKEVIYTIDFYSPPLKKHRYSMDAVFHKQRVKRQGGTGVLFDEIKRRERLEKERLAEEAARNAALAAQAASSPEMMDSPSSPVITEVPDKPKRQFRSIAKAKVDNFLFDDTAEKQGQLEDEAYETLNADGYYDELLPIDADSDYNLDTALPIKMIIIVTLLLLGVAAFLVWQMTSIF